MLPGRRGSRRPWQICWPPWQRCSARRKLRAAAGRRIRTALLVHLTRECTRVDNREPREVSFRVASSVLVRFAVRGMGVAPASLAADGTGHHHARVDKPLPLDVRRQIPFDDAHRHFGKGQTEGVLDLRLGRHKLRRVVAQERS